MIMLSKETLNYNLLSNPRGQDENDPATQIGRVLNAHMDSLQWIDQTTATVQRKLEDVTRMHEAKRKESERAAALF